MHSYLQCLLDINLNNNVRCDFSKNGKLVATATIGQEQ